jgi:hypothetical protein
MEIIAFFQISWESERERERERGVEWLSSCFSEMLEEEYGMENLPETTANITYLLSNENQVKKW